MAGVSGAKIEKPLVRNVHGETSSPGNKIKFKKPKPSEISQMSAPL